MAGQRLWGRPLHASDQTMRQEKLLAGESPAGTQSSYSRITLWSTTDLCYLVARAQGATVLPYLGLARVAL